MEAAIPAPGTPSPVERALAWMERRRGAVSMDELAAACAEETQYAQVLTA